jgi:hypothetical protein
MSEWRRRQVVILHAAAHRGAGDRHGEGKSENVYAPHLTP